jgi:lipopolysaccharide/colanic/teichoic acid biosynthesis glycosyltransferase
MAELVAQGGDGLDEPLTRQNAFPVTKQRGLRIVAAGVPVAAFGVTLVGVARVADHASWSRAVAFGAVATGLCLLAFAIDRAPSLSRAAASGLAPVVDVRAFLMLAIVLALAHEAGPFPVGVGGVIIAAAVATAAGIIAAPLGSRTRIVVVGSGRMAELAARTLASRRRTTVLGFVDAPDAGPEDASLPTLGTLDDLPEIVRRQRVDAVVLAYAWAAEPQVAQAIRSLGDADVAVALVPRLFEVLGGRMRARVIGGVPLLTLDPSLADRRLPALERAVDMVVSGMMLVLLSPLLLLIAIAVFVDSPGPVLYRAERVGRNWRPFSMLKFRKMPPDAGNGPSAVTQADDRRFTRVGRLLHDWKLDELPQLWNVLRGDMALVGPRPEDARYVALYPDAYRALLKVRPGITGIAALKYRDETNLMSGSNYEELYRTTVLPDKLDLERTFADRRSLGLALRILLWTPLALVRRGSAGRTPETGHLWFGRSRGGSA